MKNNPVIHPPKTRAKCQNDSGFCLSLTCKFHFIHVFHPNLDPIKSLLKDESNEAFVDWLCGLPESCVLDVIDKYGECTLESIGYISSVTRERIRQIEYYGLKRALKKINKIMPDYAVSDSDFPMSQFTGYFSVNIPPVMSKSMGL